MNNTHVMGEVIGLSETLILLVCEVFLYVIGGYSLPYTNVVDNGFFLE